MSLPSEYSFGKVVGRVIQAVADGSDDDRLPDAIAATGQVIFSPSEPFRRTTEDYSALVLNRKVECTIYSPPDDGYLEHHPGTLLDPQGNPGVWLSTGEWNVSFRVGKGSIPSFDIVVTGDHTADNPLDLVHAAPPQEGQGVTIVTVQVPAGGGPDETLVRGGDGQLVWSRAARDAADDAEAALAQIPAAASLAVSEAVVAQIDPVVEAVEAARDETIVEVSPLADWSGTVTLTVDEIQSKYFHRRLTGDVTLVLPEPGGGVAWSWNCKLYQDTVGGRSVTVRGAAAAYGVPVTLSAAPNSVDLLGVECDGYEYDTFARAMNLSTPTDWTGV